MKTHLEDLRDRMMAPFKASDHSVSLFHPSAVVPQGSTSRDELYQENTSLKSYEASHGGPGPYRDSTEVDTLVNEPFQDAVRRFPITRYPRTDFAFKVNSFELVLGTCPVCLPPAVCT